LCVSFRAKKAKSFARGSALLLQCEKICSSVVSITCRSLFACETALSEIMCRDWFRCFKNGDFDVEGKEHASRPKLIENAALEASLDEDPCQTQEKLAESLGVARSNISVRLKALRMIRKEIEYHMN